MAKPIYKDVKPGQWVTPTNKGYLFACCDCGLVHKMDFRVNSYGDIQFRAFRAPAATKANRRQLKKIK